MTAEATKTTRIRATQTQIGNKSLQPTDKPPRTQGSRMFQISFEGRRRQDIYISIREPSSQGAGRPVAFHPVRSAAAGRSEGDHGARRDRGTSETTGQERPRRPTRTQNRRNRGARPPSSKSPRRTPYPRIGGSRTAESRPRSGRNAFFRPKKRPRIWFFKIF